MWWFKNKNEDIKLPKWDKDFTVNDISNTDRDKLLFLLEECRLYFAKISDNTGQLINKGFILMGFAIGLFGFIFPVCASLLFIQNPDKTNVINKIIYTHWPIIGFIVFICLCCWLLAINILAKHVICPRYYSPAGAMPETTLKKRILDTDLNITIVGQMINYQKRIDDTAQRNILIQNDIETCLKLIFICPILALILLTFCLCLCHGML